MNKRNNNDNRGKSKSGRNNYRKDKEKTGRQSYSRDPIEERVHGANDVSWYTKNPAAITSARMSFANPAGYPITIESDEVVPTFSGSVVAAMPGIAVLNYAPGVGYSVDGSSAINTAARMVYTAMRKVNAAGSTYDPSDLMMYLMATDSLIQFHAWMCRVYGVLTAYSTTNRYVGDALLRAMGVNPADVRKESQTLLGYINMFAARAADFCAPKSMPIFERHAWMCTGIFADGPEEKAQYYMYNPSILYKYVETSSEPGYLEAKAFGIAETTTVSNYAWTSGGAKSVSQIMSFGEDILNTMVNSQDTRNMSGDIRRAFGAENMRQLPFIDAGFTVVPIYSQEVLYQIHNTMFTGAMPLSLDTFNIKQDAGIDGYIRYAPRFRRPNSGAFTRFIDLGINDPSPELVLVASRNMFAGTNLEFTIPLPSTPAQEDYEFRPTVFGSELVNFISLYYYSNANTLSSADLYNLSFTTTTINSYVYMAGFAYSPWMHNATYNSGAVFWSRPIGLSENYATISREQLFDMHNACLLSLFNIPLIIEGK